MNKISLIQAPLVSENYPSGVSQMAEALCAAGLGEKIHATQTVCLPVPSWKPYRDPETKILNPNEVHDYTILLANAVEKDLAAGYFPVVVGGDCTILLGTLLALRRKGETHGLLYVDGHADFYEPGISPSGETADMDLGLAVGRGPTIVTTFEEKVPLVKEEHVVLFGFRDEQMVREAGGQDVRKSAITCFSLSDIQRVGFSNAAEIALEKLCQKVERFWIHVDIDVLDDTIMPAVDYRMPGGLSFGELTSLLRRLIKTDKALGLNVTIFNPTLDWDGSLTKRLVEVFATVFRTV